MSLVENTSNNVEDYSFLKEFNDYSLFKKFISIIFLPLLPIYIISKGFQIKNWKRNKTEN